MSRALNKQMLYDDEHDFLVYLNLLSQTKKEYGIKIYAYCLMTNHVHLVICDNKDNISKAMNKLNSRYAMYYNKKNGRTGVVFNDRFKSEAIEDKRY
ncbi:MAG: transposase, partial [Lachnospiraceae bacterium]|nr:transposase [Lachnospiraceae bacterium]